mgnify:CR=1 FL=1
MKLNVKNTAPFVGLILIFVLIIARYASYTMNTVVLGIMIFFIVLIVLMQIIFRKRINSKWMFLGTISMLLCGVIAFLSMYFQHNHINDSNITLVLSPIVMIILGQSAFRYRLSVADDKKRLDTEKKKITFGTALLIFAEIFILFMVFVQKK